MINLNNLAGTVLATDATLPAIQAAYEYIVAANGLFIRAEDSRMEAMVPIALTRPDCMRDLAVVFPYANLKVPKMPAEIASLIDGIALEHFPDEVLMQFLVESGAWHVWVPQQTTTPTSIQFQDAGTFIVDVHSHGSMNAFFSRTDNADEQGLRFYCVVGGLNSEIPQMLCRVGVYGHHMNIPASTLFDDIDPFCDLFGYEE